MPRTARVAPGGMIFHVLNRGNDRRTIFETESDYLAFLRVLSETSEEVHLRILAQLGFLLRDDTLRDMVRRRVPTEEIIGRIEMLEASATTGSYAAKRP